MIKLFEMNPGEYEDFIRLANADYIKDQITAGNWTPENATEKMEQTLAEYLPNGMETPTHCFFNVYDPLLDSKIGSLWYFTPEREGRVQIFILYIYIKPEYRRQGFGTQVFEALERQAKEANIPQIGLSVFPHNTAARSLYQKIGFSFYNSDHYMVKELQAQAQE